QPFAIAREPEEILQLLETPKESHLGDDAFPCFTLAKELRRAPPQISQELAALLQEQLAGDRRFLRIEAVGPYLNFTLDKAQLAERLLPDILNGDFLARRPKTGQRVMIEYSHPNTHKAFHVGHIRNVALGDALVRICEWSGHDVVAANYIGDVGAHIAKCLWYFQNYFKGKVPKENRGEFLGELYTQATSLLDFTALNRAPHPHVVTALVIKLEPHPSNPAWIVVQVDPGDGVRQVISGGRDFGEEDIVAYARPGARIAGRAVATTDKQGVPSEGMICTGAEIGLSSDREQIYLFSPGTPVGEEIAELLRVEGALPKDRSVLAEMQAREHGVNEVLQKLEAGDPPTKALWQETREWSLAEFHDIYEWLGARFDHFFYESEVGESGKRLVKEYHQKGVFVLSEGAIGADLSQFQLPFLLLLKSNGSGLYATKDIALAQLKFDQFHIDRSVYVVDSSQSLHFQQIFKALELMGYKRAQNCFHLAYGMVVLPEGKMSSRHGTIILFSQLRERLTRHIRREFLDNHEGDWTQEEIREAARRIAIATIRYGMLNHDNKKNIVFNLEEWTDKTGNTGPYLMYAYSRTRSILRELGEYSWQNADWGQLVHVSEQMLVRRLAAFAEIVEKAARNYVPQQLCIYLYELAKEFSRMYSHCSVLRAETPKLQAARAAL
ncbi:MAG: arginine--tRNA ligase, partial [Planctomycetota bacterium]